MIKTGLKHQLTAVKLKIGLMQGQIGVRAVKAVNRFAASRREITQTKACTALTGSKTLSVGKPADTHRRGKLPTHQPRVESPTHLEITHHPPKEHPLTHPGSTHPPHRDDLTRTFPDAADG